MKFLELTAFGNKRKHFIALKSIADIDFQDKYTTIVLSNGHKLNVTETEYDIKNMIQNLDGIIIDPFYYTDITGSDTWSMSSYDEDNLPF
jgi:hypothetical protein